MTNTLELLDKLISLAIKLIEADIDNADRHQQIAESLAQHGRRRFGPRFPERPVSLADVDQLQRPGAGDE